MLEAKHFAGAPETGLDFVADQEGAKFSAKLLGSIKKVAPRKVDPLTLDRLDDEGRDVAFKEFTFECCQVIERDAPVESLHQGPEAFGKTFAAHQGKRAEAKAVKRSA